MPNFFVSLSLFLTQFIIAIINIDIPITIRKHPKIMRKTAPSKKFARKAKPTEAPTAGIIIKKKVL